MSKKEAGSLSLLQKLGYGVGDLGANFCWTFVGSFIMLYCPGTLGISAGVVGSLIAISKVLDGVTDIFMGAIIDRTHSKMGKSRFWLLVSTIPLSICTYLIFNVPASFTDNTKYIYIFVIYTLLGAVFYTMNNIAYSTLMALCTKNPKDRVQMGSFRYIFAMVAGILIQYVTVPLVEKFGGGQAGWGKVSLIFSVLCFVILMIPILSVKELPEEELNQTGGVKQAAAEKLSFGQTIKALVSNKYFLLILCYYFFMYLLSFTSSSLTSYYALYCLNSQTAMGSIAMVSYVPTVVVLTFVAGITKKYGIRRSAFAGHCVALLGAAICFFGGMFAKNAFLFVLIGLAIRGLGMAPMSGSINALIAAADDYQELKTGHRMTGAFFSCSSVGIKVGTGLGTALSGILVDLAKVNFAEGAVQTAATLSVIKWGYLLPTLLFPIMTLLVLSAMDVEEKSAQLRKERAASEQ